MLAYLELDDALGLSDLAGAVLSECRRAKDTRHLLTGRSNGGAGTWERKPEAERRMNMDNALSFVADHTSTEARIMFDCDRPIASRRPHCS